MASSEDYLTFILERLEALPGIRHRKMMGEYLIYLDDVLVGGIYDDRFLLKDTEPGRKLMPHAETTFPYDGAKTELLVVDCLDDAEALCEVVQATAGALS